MEFEHEKAEAPDVWSPPPKVPNQILLELIGGNLLAEISEGSSRFSDPVSPNVIGGRRVMTVVIEERADVEEIVNIVPEFLEIPGQLRWAVDISGNHMKCRNSGLSQVLFRDSPRYLVKVGPHQKQRVILEHLAPWSSISHHLVEVLEQSAIATPHVADASGLSVERPVEDLHNDLVDLLEIGFVRAAATPHIHAPIDEQFDAVLVEPRYAGVSKQQCAHIVEERKIGDRYSVGSGDFRGIAPTGSEPHAIVLASDPALRAQQ